MKAIASMTGIQSNSAGTVSVSLSIVTEGGKLFGSEISGSFGSIFGLTVLQMRTQIRNRVAQLVSDETGSPTVAGDVVVLELL